MGPPPRAVCQRVKVPTVCGEGFEGGDLLPGSSRAKDPSVVEFIFVGFGGLIFVFQVCILPLPFGSSIG